MPSPPPSHPDPEIRAYIRRCGGYSAFAARHGITIRTAQRIFSGAAPCPESLRRQCLGPWIDEGGNQP